MKNKTLCRLVVAFSLGSIFLPSVAIAKTNQNEPGITRSINELSWLSGRWKSKNEKPSFEEHWMTPHDGFMIGMGRELNGSKMEFFEYLRIEQRKDGVYYVAQPRGKAQTDFKLTSANKVQNSERFKFENPMHDFPKSIEYEKRTDGSLLIRVSGDDTKEKSFQHVLFRF